MPIVRVVKHKQKQRTFNLKDTEVQQKSYVKDDLHLSTSNIDSREDLPTLGLSIGAN